MAGPIIYPIVTDFNVTSDIISGYGTIVLDGKFPNQMNISGVNFLTSCNVLISDSENNSYNSGIPINRDMGTTGSPIYITFTATPRTIRPGPQPESDEKHEVHKKHNEFSIRHIQVTVTVTNNPGGSGTAAGTPFAKLTQVS